MTRQILFLLFIFNLTLSQAQNLEGFVKSMKNKPIEGAYILNVSSGTHAHSNKSGAYSIQDTHVGDTLRVSHLNYINLVITVKSVKEPLNIEMKEQALSIDEIVVSPEINALKLITDIDIQTKPVISSQEVLQQVPGLIIGQHAGGGKAEQIFLRGFDIDHGTDINITVDGLPVNMVSHAHGQGYADLHFIIPETLDKIDFDKGCYNPEKGNFATAGYADFRTKEQLENNLVKTEIGEFNHKRLVGLFNVLEQNKQTAYFASEFIKTDGAFDSPQNFARVNLFGKYTSLLNNEDKIGLTLSHFKSSWDASGQVPQRAVENGTISRFGAIDDTEGGFTSRNNFKLNYHKHIDDNTYVSNQFYYSQYNFDLYSNFTFFLNDPVNGDQIKQKESRDIYGFKSVYHHSFSDQKREGNWKAGAELRNDQSKNNTLSHTLNRKTTIEEIRLGDINELNFGAFVSLNYHINKWTFNPSVRVDYFDFQYQDKLADTYATLSQNKSIVSPKLNILYSASDALQLYLKTGKGFHSNDSRVVVAQEGHKILPASYGADIGFVWKPVSRMVVNTAYWYLFLEQEFVYVGDEGVVEPSGKTQRHGFDLSIRYQILDWLYSNFDMNYTHGRATEEAEGEQYLPLAPDFTSVGGLNAIHPSGIYGGINYRLVDDRPANEDNSIVAKGYTVVDANVGYKWKHFDVGFIVQNIFNTEWNETQFATESRLQNEVDPVEEIHFIPGTPRFIRANISYSF